VKFLLSCFLLIATCFVAASLNAAAVRVVALEDEVSYQTGDSSPPAITLQLENIDAGETPTILLWQLGLEIVPADGATGSVSFLAAEEPSDYLFFADSSPMSSPMLPQPVSITSLDISGANILAPSGTSLAFGSPRNVVDLTFTVSDDAAGRFEIVLAPFSTSPFGSSAWAPQIVLDPKDNMEFDNARAGSSSASRVVASIEVLTVPEPSSFVTLGIGLAAWTVLRKRRAE